MSEQDITPVDETQTEGTGFSRRNALKLGVAAGVGAVAWSGPAITSLGGTPVYAAGCTFVQKFDLSGGCRNTDQRNCGDPGATLAWHPLTVPQDPNYYWTTNPVIPSNDLCNYNNVTVTFSFPAGVTCQLFVDIARNGSCTNIARKYHFGPSATSPIIGYLPNGGPFNAAAEAAGQPTGTGTFSGGNIFYNIYANCATTGADPACLK